MSRLSSRKMFRIGFSFPRLATVATSCDPPAVSAKDDAAQDGAKETRRLLGEAASRYPPSAQRESAKRMP